MSEDRFRPKAPSDHSIEAEVHHALPELTDELRAIVDSDFERILEHRLKHTGAIDQSGELARAMQTIRESGTVDEKAEIAMNNFRFTLPGYEKGLYIGRYAVANLEEAIKNGEEKDQEIIEAVEQGKRIFAAVDNLIARHGWSDQDIADMRDVPSLRKEHPKRFAAARRRLTIAYAELRDAGFSIKQLST